MLHVLDQPTASGGLEAFCIFFYSGYQLMEILLERRILCRKIASQAFGDWRASARDCG